MLSVVRQSVNFVSFVFRKHHRYFFGVLCLMMLYAS